MTRRAALASGRGHTGDPKMDEVWRQIRALIDQVNGGPFAGARLITEEEDGVRGSGLAFAAGTARSIPHRLGRRARGFLEVYGADVSSANHVRLRASAHPTGVTSDTHVTVTPTASGTCLLLVF